MRKRILTLLLALLSLTTFATEGDSLVVSLLTCGPGAESYELYGHTALRVQQLPDTTGASQRSARDFVFGYGFFSFKTPHFAWRWLLGETDYTMGAQPYLDFLTDYISEGRWINEVVLNLTPEEKQRLAVGVSANTIAAREGWTYRYNFLLDNCTTRAIDAIEAVLGDSAEIVWPEAEEKTWRGILHEFTEPHHAWVSFGQDMLIGEGVDRPTDVREQMFAPIYAERYVMQAKIKRADGALVPLVLSTSRVDISSPTPTNELAENLTSPMAAASAFALLLFLLAMWEKSRRGRWIWGVDVAVMTIQGLVGILIALLFFWSEHPTVDTNWLIIWFNPLWLGGAIWLTWHKLKYHTVPARYFTVMAVLWYSIWMVEFLGNQQIPEPVYVVMTILMLRAIILQMNRRYEK